MSQGTYTPLGTATYHIMDRMDIKYGKILPLAHTSVKPYSKTMLGSYAESLNYSNLELSKGDQYDLKYLLMDNTEWTDSLNYHRKAFLKTFFPENASLLAVNTPSFTLRMNPILQFDYGKELDDRAIFNFNKGVEFRAYIKKKLGFYFFMGTVQTRYLSYIRDERVNREFQNVPQNGFFKNYKELGHDYFTARGYMTFNVLDHVDFQFGYDNPTIGNGYRSLLLSNNANAFLFLKMNIKVWKINYQTIFAELIGQYDRAGDRLLDKKYAAFHHLNFNVTKWLDIGVFEGVIMARSNNFELHYLNPLIFYRSIEQDLGSPDNSVIGFDYKVNIAKSLQLYGQLVMDEFNFEQIRARNGWWANKYALQFGGKYIDVAGIDHLDLQLEYNVARPFIYTHNQIGNKTLANYTHYNQELAHPLGANFREFIMVARYRVPTLPALTFQLEYMNYSKGTDTTGLLMGGDIFQSSTGVTATREFDNSVGQGIAHRVNYVSFLASYEFWHNMYADLNIGARGLNSDYDPEDETDVFFSLGVRMNLPYRRNAY